MSARRVELKSLFQSEVESLPLKTFYWEPVFEKALQDVGNRYLATARKLNKAEADHERLLAIWEAGNVLPGISARGLDSQMSNSIPQEESEAIKLKRKELKDEFERSASRLVLDTLQATLNAHRREKETIIAEAPNVLKTFLVEFGPPDVSESEAQILEEKVLAWSNLSLAAAMNNWDAKSAPDVKQRMRRKEAAEKSRSKMEETTEVPLEQQVEQLRKELAAVKKRSQPAQNSNKPKAKQAQAKKPASTKKPTPKRVQQKGKPRQTQKKQTPKSKN